MLSFSSNFQYIWRGCEFFFLVLVKGRGFFASNMRLLLFSRHSRQEPISGIAYMHRIDDNGMNGPEVDRNFKILLKIAGDQQHAARNVIFVTTGWEKPVPQGVDRAANQASLQTFLTPMFNSDQIMEHDGSKWSALRIVNVLKRKTPMLFYIQTELANNANPAFTSATVELVDDINAFIQAKQAEDVCIRDELQIARRGGDRARVTTLANNLTQLGVFLDRLRAEETKLEVSIDWDQATRDNVQIEAKITEQYTLATTDWKAEYDKVKVEVVCILITIPKQISHTKVQY